MTTEPTRRKKRRWGDQATPTDESTNTDDGVTNDAASRKAALQASIQARLAALKARTTAPPAAAIANSNQRPLPSSTSQPQKRARVFELDLNDTTSSRLLEKQKRDEQLKSSSSRGDVQPTNPYLAHTAQDTRDGSSQTDGTAPTSEDVLDSRLAGGQIAKTRLKSRPISFVTPGTYIALGEKKRQQAIRAQESGYVSGRKDGHTVTSVGMGGVSATYGEGEAGKCDDRLAGRMDAPDIQVEDYLIGGKRYRHSKELSEMTDEQKGEVALVASLHAAENAMPYAMEWWDAELLPGKLKKELATEEGKAIVSRAKKQASVVTDQEDTKEEDSTPPQERRVNVIERCYKHASLTHSKSHSLLQHPIPVLSPALKAAAEALRNKPPTLHLTKAERKRHRKLRRAERLREQQDMQAAGLVPAPEPRLTLSNYMKVLGDQAILDPSKMEAKVMEQVHRRKLKHERMNEERKLTKEQKAAKHARKLAEDTSTSVQVALFWVKDMSHPYHRAKVDLNAQQNSITGGVLECDQPGKSEKLVLVVAEGGEKAIKRYIRLMTVRMKWRGEDFFEEDNDEEEDEEETKKKFNLENECELIWTGMAVKRAFHTFMFQSAQNPMVARKILEAKGVAHYWDLCVGLVERKENGGSEGMKLFLGSMKDDVDMAE